MKRLVTVLAGGLSAEHEVSLNSADQIVQNLDQSSYQIQPVFISKNNKWKFLNPSQKFTTETKGSLSLLDGLKKLANLKPDVVFIGLHGTFGEDGKIQAFLEELGIKFTGSGSFASALAIDKVVSQDLLEAHGLKAIPTLDFFNSDWKDNKASVINQAKKLGDILIVKPADSGSSLGVCKTPSNGLDRAIATAFDYSSHVMVQACIVGQEFSCGVLEQPDNLAALPATEIIPKKGDFYDYTSKYETGGSEHVVPAQVSPELMGQLQEQAVKAHVVLGCKGYSRTDFLYANNSLYTLETNTLPGMTPTSLLPEQAKAGGIDFSRLLDIIIGEALSREP